MAYLAVVRECKFNWVEFISKVTRASVMWSAPGLMAAGVAAGLEYYNDCHAQEAPVQAEEIV